MHNTACNLVQTTFRRQENRDTPSGRLSNLSEWNTLRLSLQWATGPYDSSAVLSPSTSTGTGQDLAKPRGPVGADDDGVGVHVGRDPVEVHVGHPEAEAPVARDAVGAEAVGLPLHLRLVVPAEGVFEAPHRLNCVDVGQGHAPEAERAPGRTRRRTATGRRARAAATPPSESRARRRRTGVAAQILMALPSGTESSGRGAIILQ